MCVLFPGVARLPARWYKETLEPVSPGARIVAHFEGGRPAAVMSTFGKGRTLEPAAADEKVNR